MRLNLPLLVLTLLYSLSGLASPPTQSENTADTSPLKVAQVAIIIDDIGYSLSQGMIAARFPGALTLAVLPHTPNGIALAELGHEQGKDIMLHVPMSNLLQLPLDPGGLTEHMPQAQFIEILHNNLSSIPHVRGLNNHMGSYLTQLEEPMQWLMTELKNKQLFFIDSRTSSDSVAWSIAVENHIPSLKRDIFLDNERTEAAIAHQYQQLLRIAHRYGSALAIGHPYPETLAFLQQQAPLLEQQGIELVSISTLLNTRVTPPKSLLLKTNPE